MFQLLEFPKKRLHWFIWCTVPVHLVYCPGSSGVLSRFIWCTVPVHLVYCLGSFGVLSRFIWCTVSVHLVYRPSSFGVPPRFIWCTVPVHLVYCPGSFLNVPVHLVNRPVLPYIVCMCLCTLAPLKSVRYLKRNGVYSAMYLFFYVSMYLYYLYLCIKKSMNRFIQRF